MVLFLFRKTTGYPSEKDFANGTTEPTNSIRRFANSKHPPKRSLRCISGETAVSYKIILQDLRDRLSDDVKPKQRIEGLSLVHMLSEASTDVLQVYGGSILSGRSRFQQLLGLYGKSGH